MTAGAEDRAGPYDGPIGGFTLPGFEAVADEFSRNFRDRGEGGAAFSAVVDGRLAVDLWGGYADWNQLRPWRADTLAGLFSGTKGLVATCLLLLIERGHLDLDQPVCTYWPEFAAHGKDEILVRHAVSHHAALPGLTTPVTAEQATDAVLMARLLADEVPVCEPGTRLYYHAMTFGWLCGELIRRIDGRSVGRFFQDEVARPLRLEAWIGLPAEHDARVAVFDSDDGFAAPRGGRDGGAGAASLAWSIWDNPPRLGVDPLPANLRYWRAAEIPSSNGTAAVRSMARLYGCLAAGGAVADVRLLQPWAIRLGTTQLAGGLEPFIDERMAFGVGFQLQTDAARFGPTAIAFGHTGVGGGVHGAWPQTRTGFSYSTNTLRDAGGIDPRAGALLDALHTAVSG